MMTLTFTDLRRHGARDEDNEAPGTGRHRPCHPFDPSSSGAGEVRFQEEGRHASSPATVHAPAAGPGIVVRASADPTALVRAPATGPGVAVRASADPTALVRAPAAGPGVAVLAPASPSVHAQAAGPGVAVHALVSPSVPAPAAGPGVDVRSPASPNIPAPAAVPTLLFLFALWPLPTFLFRLQVTALLFLFALRPLQKACSCWPMSAQMRKRRPKDCRCLVVGLGKGNGRRSKGLTASIS